MAETAPAGGSGLSMAGKTGGSPGRALLDHVPEMVTISDREGRIVYANPATGHISGFAPEEFVALDPFERMHPEDRPRCEEAFEELLGTPGLSVDLEHRVRHKDGTWRWVEGTFTSLFDDPDVGGLLATVRDITARKRAEEALRESEERQAFLLELEDALRPIADAVEVQVKAQRLLGQRLRASRVFYVEVEPDADRIVIRRDYASGVASVAGRYAITQLDARAREHWRAGSTVNSEDVEKDAWLSPSQIAALRATEVRAWLGVPLLKGGRLAAILGVHQSEPREWTPAEVALVQEVAERTWAAVERARAEEVLRESEERYRGIFDSIDEGFVVAELLFDDEGKPFDLLVLETNPSFDRMMRTTDAVGKRAKEIFPDAESSWFEAYGRVVGTGESLRFENYLGPLDSWFELYVSRIGGVDSSRFAIVFNDITERKRAEERQAYLLKLSDALRPLASAKEIKATATRIIGDHLGTDRTLYAEHVVKDGEEYFLVDNVYFRPGFPYPDGLTPVASFGRDAYEVLKGRTVVVNDVEKDPGIATLAKERFRAASLAAYVALPLMKEGQFVAVFGVLHARPRIWRPDELALIEETAERIWAAVERARAEEALRASEEKYRTLFESMDEGFCIVEVILDGAGEPVDYRFVETNPAFERHTGLRDAAGKRMRELEPRHERHWFEAYGRVALTGNPERFQNAAEHLGGRLYDVYAFRVGSPEERKVAILFADITRRREAEEERLRLRLLEASVRAEVAESQRIGRELHDRVAHTMGVAHQSLQLHQAYAQSDPSRAAEKLSLATEATKTALDQTRDLSAQLARPEAEETRDGLGAALRNLLESHVPPRVEAKLSVEGDETAVPPRASEQAYLVIREAVRNAVAHSGCERIDVILEVDDSELRGRVEDDGVGFDPGREWDDREEGEPATGVGLRSMRERTELLGGRLDVSSKPGRGTAVEVRVPLAD